MAISRRVLLTGLLLLVAPPALANPGRHVHPHGPKRRRRRRVRRRVRRHRIRRRARWRMLRGRRVLVVPVGLAVGWELSLDDRIVVVREVHEHKIVVEHADGTAESIDVAKEDTAENTNELEGSEYEVEIEEDVVDGE